uniref:Uncharacterized protein n=1 Tax=viral metagenome TaxID=1070528 RepID=A0A6C0JXI1_9ZZZZ
MSQKYHVKVKSVKFNIRQWTVYILQETLRILHDNDEVTEKLNKIKHNIEMILHYLTSHKINTGSNEAIMTSNDVL